MLAFPADTIIVWKSHDDSIVQRSAIDQARQEKTQITTSNPTGHSGVERRRAGHDDADKGKGSPAL